MACISPLGPLPSAQPLWEQKLYSVVSVPLGVILKTVPPLPLAPSPPVVPYKFPSAACTSVPEGTEPSAQPLSEQKVYSVVSVPPGVILKNVPPIFPPPEVVPYKFPLVAWSSPAEGHSPSGQLLWEQKLYSVVNAPLGVILNTVPHP